MFEPTSRYAALPRTTLTSADSRHVAYVRRRFLPRGETLPLLVEVTIAEGDRLDGITAATLGDPEQFWRVGDANNAMNPFDLTAEPGRTLRVPVQRGSDLAYLQQLAARHAYVFYVIPGPAPFTNTAYWGPPQRQGLPQRALSVNLGATSNVDAISFQQQALAPALVSGVVQDSRTDVRLPVRTFAGTRVPLSSQPTWLVDAPHVRRRQFQASGLTAPQAFALAQATTDASSDAVLASGELDTLRYGDLLQARGLVGLRGAGYSYDGLYYVQSVTHVIGKGFYKQRFTLAREGLGALLPLVAP